MFADDGKIITRKVERQRVNKFKLIEVQIANVAANDAVGLIGANISSVSRAGRRVDVVCQSVNNLRVGLNVGMSRAPGQPPAPKFSSRFLARTEKILGLEEKIFWGI